MFLGWPNRIDEATLSGGSWTNAALTNLQTRDVGEQARSADATTANTKILIDLGTTNYAIRAITLHNHNLSSAAQIRTLVGTSSGGSEVYNPSLANAWQMTTDNDTLSLASDAGARHMIVDILDQYHSRRYFTIEISDTGNSDGYIEIGRVGIWSGFTPTDNMSWGVREGAIDNSSKGKAITGGLLFDKRARGKTASFLLDFLTDAEAEKMHNLQVESGVTDEILYLPDLTDEGESQRYGVYGTLRELGPLERKFLNSTAAEYAVEPII